MNLTIAEALERAIEAHKNGQILEADRLYTAILEVQRDHPDANHNLGVLAIGIDKLDKALPFFRAAIEANNKVPQFWLSYIDTLIKLDDFKKARKALEESKAHCQHDETFSKIKAILEKQDDRYTNDFDKKASLRTEEKTQNTVDVHGLSKALRLAQFEAKAGNIENSTIIYKEILSRYPKNKVAIDAIKKFRKLRYVNEKAATHPPQDKLKTIVNLYNQAKFDDALAASSELVIRYPKSATLHNLLGAINSKIGDNNKAVAYYKQAIEINPNSAEAYNNMGAALRLLGQLDEALDAYRNAIKLKPNYPEAYNNLGTVLNDKNETDLALQNFEKALLINPHYPDALNNMGILLNRVGQRERAIGTFREVIALAPEHADAFNNLGNALRLAGSPTEAIDAYKKAISLDQSHAEAMNNLGVVLKDQGDFESAISVFGNAISQNPDFADPYNHLGNLFILQGKHDKAVHAFKKAIKLRPEYYDAFNNLGNALSNLGKYEDAIVQYQRAFELYPKFAEALNNIGNTLKKQGKIEEAKEAFRKALKIRPNYPLAMHLLSSLEGKTTNTAPRDYVEPLFDEYATRFEFSLVKKLDYDAPKVISKTLLARDVNSDIGKVLDLGCGTGLLGLEIAENSKYLVGIDVSKSMLNHAKTKEIYDELHHIDIHEYLTQNVLDFDYYFASDVFIYVGNLLEIFRTIKAKTKKSGRLVFTTEHIENNGFHLLESGRYAHSKSYIENLCKEFDYDIMHCSLFPLRKERESILIGALYELAFEA